MIRENICVNKKAFSASLCSFNSTADHSEEKQMDSGKKVSDEKKLWLAQRDFQRTDNVLPGCIHMGFPEMTA